MQTVRLRPDVAAPCAGARPAHFRQAEIIEFPGRPSRAGGDADWLGEVEQDHWFFARGVRPTAKD